MSNLVELRPKNCTDTLKKAVVVAAKGFAAAAAVTAVAGAIFLIIAASVNPWTTPGFLGYMAMIIAKSKPVLGLIPYKTCIYVGSCLILTMSLCYLFLVGATFRAKERNKWLQGTYQEKIDPLDRGVKGDLIPRPFYLSDQFLKDMYPSKQERKQYFTRLRKAGVPVKAMRAYPWLCSQRKKHGDHWKAMRPSLIAAALSDDWLSVEKPSSASVPDNKPSSASVRDKKPESASVRERRKDEEGLSKYFEHPFYHSNPHKVRPEQQQVLFEQPQQVPFEQPHALVEESGSLLDGTPYYVAEEYPFQ